ncbi:helix-turn-helix domain-containing protein [Nocardia amamiensis]|uniref:helix-turn-helix domain-containing protein n=1 Tax=Nocardia amamiensis TaxID=404578 RepID=UPI000AC3F8F0
MTLGVCADTVRKWRKRFCRNGIKDLADLPRSGGPRAFAAGSSPRSKALACELPAWSGLPLARWSCPELAREAATRGITDRISTSTVRRWLADDAIKPWQHRSWIFPRDPISRSRPAECSTSTPGSSTGNHLAPTNSCCRLTRNLASRPERANTPA